MIELVVRDSIPPLWWDSLDSDSRPTGYYFTAKWVHGLTVPFNQKPWIDTKTTTHETTYTAASQ